MPFLLQHSLITNKYLIQHTTRESTKIVDYRDKDEDEDEDKDEDEDEDKDKDEDTYQPQKKHPKLGSSKKDSRSALILSSKAEYPQRVVFSLAQLNIMAIPDDVSLVSHLNL